MRRTRIKICCIQSEAEAQLAIAHGADALGLVGTMPSGPGPIDDDLIAAITGRLWPLGGETVFVPGHGPASNFAHERRTNPYVADSVLARG